MGMENLRPSFLHNKTTKLAFLVRVGEAMEAEN
jgi:hypothetical protein